MSSVQFNPYTCPMEMEWTNRGQIPSFGNWDFYDELPVTQYFNSAREAGLVRRHFFVDDVDLDLFKVAPSPLPYHYQKPRRLRTERKKARSLHDKWDLKELKKQGRVYDESHQKQKQQEQEHEQQQRRQRTPKAVDEDLYKIPPELLYQKPRRVGLSDFWKGCLGLSCVA